MRVLISGLSAPTELNGVSRHAANLARGLLSLPDPPEIHFLAGEWQSRNVRAGHRIEPCPPAHAFDSHPPSQSRAHPLVLPRTAPHRARELGADVVHLSYTMPLDARAFACPTVVSLHDLVSVRYSAELRLAQGTRSTAQLMHQCLRNVDAIACVSESTRTRLKRRFGAPLSRKAVTILQCGRARSSALQRDARRQLSGNESIPSLRRATPAEQEHPAGAARLRAPPSQPRSARRCAAADRRNSRSRHAADPDAHTPESGLERKCMLISGISDAELQWCYRNCELLLAPSSIEGFGLPVAEALLAGCPVVCSDIPAFREIGGDHCRYVRVRRKYRGTIRRRRAGDARGTSAAIRSSCRVCRRRSLRESRWRSIAGCLHRTPPHARVVVLCRVGH